ncbi:MAG: 50S ribosomal protein L15 [Methylococcaceae bacterium TMED69]|nr:MAG: 50S ribosomal protein L15 [Methylococcaceae bacterium TMED69]|tara:strand:- start:1252 stop:1686 length:435 start_codon:yes stop_codon:yes gene_type:complete
MRLNNLHPGKGSNKPAKRKGRGIGSGLGKTCGRGHKGQKSRSGGFHKTGFEGGQMPLQRRLPKYGFRSRTAKFCEELRLDAFENSEFKTVDIEMLRKENLIRRATKKVKIIGSGEITKPIKFVGIKATKSATKQIEKSGGSLEE